jgi:hypothetical protein
MKSVVGAGLPNTFRIPPYLGVSAPYTLTVHMTKRNMRIKIVVPCPLVFIPAPPYDEILNLA